LGESGIDRKVMTYYPAADRKFYVNDDEGNFWSLFLFIKDSHGIEQVSKPLQAYAAGKAFGQFQSQLADLSSVNLIETIPDYHNGEFRLKQLNEAIKNDSANRLDSVKDIAGELLKRAQEMTQLQKWITSGKLPVRITHNDTKINNILFDKDNNTLCVIDLDTVMPSTVLIDFGDAIRCLGNTVAEDEPDLTKIGFHKEYFEAYTKGYLEEANKFLTPFEKENLSYSCCYMAWEQSVRFFTDYLNGDTYYKIGYPEHNLVRTKAQLRYLEVLEENKSTMEKIIESF
jgi:serine/threonine protein kinase